MLSITQIKNYPIFTGLSDAELTELAACLSKRSFARGAYLYYPDSPSVNIYLIASGLVKMFFTDLEGREYMLDVLGGQAMVGFPMMYESQVRVAGAVTLMPTSALVMQRETLMQFTQRSPRLMNNIYLGMDLTLRKLFKHLQVQVSFSVVERLAAMLVYLNRIVVKQGGSSNEIDLPLSQTDLAGWIGTSRGHVNRSLSSLQKAGLIRLEGQKIILLDVPGLQKMLDERITKSL
jgi:CRP-like cAMP-binding protein